MKPPIILLIPSIAGFGLFVVAAAVAWRNSVLLTNPNDYLHPLPANFQYEETPLSAEGLAFEDMTIKAPDSAAIRGWLIPAPGGKRDVAIVALHGRGGNRMKFMTHVPMLHSAGAAVALIDLRENGLSDGSGRGTALGMREAEDAIATAADLRSRGYRKIVLLGCSLGASAAIIAAARDVKIAGVIAESPLESFSAYARDRVATRLTNLGSLGSWIAPVWANLVVGLTRLRLGLARLENPIDVVAKITPRPVLIIHGGRDEAVPLAHGQHLAARAGVSARFLALPRAGHCNGFEIEPAAYADAVRRLIERVGSPPQ